jgi:hypothetical protein
MAAAESSARRASLKAKRLLLAYLCPDCEFFHIGPARSVLRLVRIPDPIRLCTYCRLRPVSKSETQKGEAAQFYYCSKSCQRVAALLLSIRARLKNSYLGPKTGAFTTYGIVDPRTGCFVYVGQTSDFEHRKRVRLQKLEEGRKRPAIAIEDIDNWLYDTLAAGITPVIVPLETVGTWQASLKSELDWVLRLAAENHPLLNLWPEHIEAIQMAIAGESERPRTLPAGVRPSPIEQESNRRRSQSGKPRLLKEDAPPRGNRGMLWTKAFD